jgi:Putative protein-S-isoprenylcysteine methyltransferase
MEDKAKLSKSKAFIVPAIIATVMALVLFLPAGSLRYRAGWLWWSVTSAMIVFTTIYFLKKDPGLLARRMKVKEKEPQPVFVRVLSILLMLSFLIPGFDYRLHWSAVPGWIIIIANTAVFLGFAFIFLVFKENSYASTIVQVEKEQKVITSGPYAIVRHPMYAALLLINLFTPLALGSYWMFIYFFISISLNLSRIKKEEAMLLRELPGYAEYCKKTRYRLIPLIW